MAKDNKTLGRFQLADVPPAPRGVPQIEVTFDIDANGLINISAKDKGTGKEQSIKIEASSGLSDADIEKMKAEAEANADADNKLREEVELVNKADSLIFQTERQLKEYGDKLPEDKKVPIEDSLAELKKEYEAKNMDNLEPAMEKLNEVFSAASEEMYKAGNTEGGDDSTTGGENGEGEVTDVDFEEVKEEVEEK